MQGSPQTKRIDEAFNQCEDDDLAAAYAFTEAKSKVPDWGDIVDSGTGLRSTLA